jgi:hypothetical protein
MISASRTSFRGGTGRHPIAAVKCPDLGDPISPVSPPIPHHHKEQENRNNGLRWRSRSPLHCPFSLSSNSAKSPLPSFPRNFHASDISLDTPSKVLVPLRNLHDIALKPLWNGVRLLHIVGISFGNRMMSYAGLNEDTGRHLWRGGVGDGINRCVIWRTIVVLYWTQNVTPSHNHILYMSPSCYSPLPWDD